MSEKTFNSRIIHKHDTEANWNNATSFIPFAGEIIIYDADAEHDYERIKVGDGTSNINSLEFINDFITDDEIDEICGASLSNGEPGSSE